MALVLCLSFLTDMSGTHALIIIDIRFSLL